MRRVAVALVVAVVLAGCSYQRPPREDPPAPPAVQWDAYDPSVKQRIDELATAADCAGLQDEFDVAEANVSEDRARLMAYIDYQLREAGCYNDK